MPEPGSRCFYPLLSFYSFMEFPTYENRYRKELLESVIPFWESHSIDIVQGGFYNSLERDGSVYDTEKYMWMQ